MWSSKKNSDAGEGAGEEEVKVVLVGDAQCGKTALVHRLTTDTYSDAYSPTGFEKYAYTCTVADYKVNFSVWDTSGTPSYDSVRPLAYQDARVYMLCFSVGDPDSLNSAASKWYREVRTHGGLTTPVLLCGCKADLRQDPELSAMLSKMQTHPITSEQALNVARQLGAATYVETSSRTSSKGVKDAFEVAAMAALGKLNKIKQQQVGRSKSKRDLKAELKGRAKSCCVM